MASVNIPANELGPLLSKAILDSGVLMFLFRYALKLLAFLFFLAILGFMMLPFLTSSF